jgi:malate dehydrogenase (oxaloacetate-decarboxylating)(NADP+)
MAVRRQEALDYHSQGRPGKIQIALTKPCKTQLDLSLAYTPGVAEPCLDIEKNPDDAYLYTARGNLVAVVSNGTAVLGLGNIGPLAGKPVMEGKGVLFKAFADIDVFDLDINAPTPQECIAFCKMLEPTVGGINLEDIKAPDCFEVEEELKRTLDIPVFHDDQHGTAIISGAALINAAELVGKRLEDLKVVFSGAGASAIATANHYLRLGCKRENVTIVDTKGVVHAGRTDLNKYKQAYARKTDARQLADALVDADVLVGLSVAGAVTPDMLKKMAPRPIIFALANPVPEIMPEDARAARPDAIIATGRSDYPNQVNNVLGFPFIFRGALDVHARAVNDEMKMAATKALAELAKQDVPDAVRTAYGVDRLHFGPEYLIPKPLDPRVLLWEAPAVAEAAMRTGVARKKIDLEQYRAELEARLGYARALIRGLTARAAARPQRIVFAEGWDPRILRAARQLVDEKIAKPIVLGEPDRIAKAAKDAEIPLDNITVVNPSEAQAKERYAQALWQRRQRKGITLGAARHLLDHPHYFSSMMVAQGDADAMVGGIEQYYPDKLHAPLQAIGVDPEAKVLAGVFMMVVEKNVYFVADTTVNVNPDAPTLAKIASETARLVRRLGVTPRVAFLSFSNFGSARFPETAKVQEAVRLLQESEPELEADGELMAETALEAKLLKSSYPFSRLTGPANVLIFPDLNAGNIGYQLLKSIAKAEAIGPILVGMGRPVHILQRDVQVQDVINVAVIAAVDAQERAHWD